MFNPRKRHIEQDGKQAMAVVTHVGYATVFGLTEQRNNLQMKLDVTLMVRPDDDAPFEAHIKDWFSPFAEPSVRDQLWVRYDASNKKTVVIDNRRIDQDNAAYEASVASAAASAVPRDLAANGILGRGAVVDVQKTPAGSLVVCSATLGVRLVDGSEPYRASCHISLSPDQAEKLQPGSTYVTVRADPSDRSRIAISLDEPTPVVTVNDPRATAPSVRALTQGVPVTVTVLASGRQWLQTPEGQEFYAIKVRVDPDGAEFQVNQPVPPNAEGLLQSGARLPAKRLIAEPNVLAIDFSAASAALLPA